jgi:sRNA-binding carbon storage regulator CsrA
MRLGIEAPKYIEILRNELLTTQNQELPIQTDIFENNDIAFDIDAKKTNTQATKEKSADESQKLFTEQEAAEYISMSQAFLRQDRLNGFRNNRTRGPDFLRLGRSIRYTKKHLDEWLKENHIKRTLPKELIID